MSIKIGSISAKDIYIGSTPAKEIRLGSTLIWSRAQEINDTLKLNLGEGIDYTDIWYREPNSSDWVNASKTYSITVIKGTEYYIEVGYINGYYPNHGINLGSKSQPLVLDNDTTVDIYGFAEDLQEYNITVRTTHHAYSSTLVDSIIIKTNDSIIGSSYNSSEASAVHSGTEPITVEVNDGVYSYNGFTWTGSIQPVTDNWIPGVFNWDSLPENGTLTVDFSN